MAKVGRKSWTEQLSRPVRERIEAAVDAGESPAAAYVRFNVQQYDVTLRTFRLYCETRRRDNAATGEAAPPVTRGSAQTLLDSALEALQTALDARTLKPHKLTDVIHAVAALAKIDLAKAAGERAEELHAVRMAELRSRQTAAVDQVAAEHGLTAEVLAEIKARVIGI